MTFVYLIGGLAVLTIGAELLVRGASRLAALAGISPLVIGLTVVAFGTSAPELAVSAGAALSGATDLSVGNVVGSNIANTLLILGLGAMIRPLVVNQQLIRLELPVLIGISILTYLLALNGRMERYEGILLVVCIVIYTVFTVRQSRKESQAVRAEYEREFQSKTQSMSTDAEPEFEEERKIGAISNRPIVQVGLAVLLTALGLAMLVQGADWLVTGAVQIARWLRVDELVIGLTVVAVGTSLPELATSVMAAIRGETDIAVGNVVGSNMFNLMFVLGGSAIIAPGSIPVPDAALSFDIPVMIAATIACLPISFTGRRIARAEGWLFFGYYAVYVFILVLAAAGNPLLHTVEMAVLFFAVPLTIVGITFSLWQTYQLRRK